MLSALSDLNVSGVVTRFQAGRDVVNPEADRYTRGPVRNGVIRVPGVPSLDPKERWHEVGEALIQGEPVRRAETA